MSDQHCIGMLLDHRGPRGQEALRKLREALPDATFSPPDEDGAFEIAVTAPDFDEALHLAWNAVAAAGADDHLRFLEHPDLPEHWRHRAERPSPS